MLSRRFLGAAFVACVLSSSAHANFLPRNNLHLEVLRAGPNLTEKDFNDVIDEAVAVYTPIIKSSFGGTLKVSRLWTDTTVNASASQFGSNWQVNMYGGLARRPEVTRDGFALVLCHEIGHHVGGYPFSSSWAANEGESDYFATLGCARLLWSDEPEKNALSRDVIDEYPKSLCDNVWTTVEDQNLCYRILLGSKSLADLLSALRNSVVDFKTPDLTQVKTTNNAHPQGQCRLDTYTAGALCVLGFDSAVIPGKSLGSRRNSVDAETVSARYTCLETEYSTGTRPHCWFKPYLTKPVGFSQL